jgi:transcriptional regulator with PAS, ATPase and Fis domain
LLRVLQEGEIKPVGGTKIIPVDVRIIAATNKNLEDLVKEGNFREDLYYRLNVFPIILPPLHERREDIPDLVTHFVQKYAAKINKKITGIEQKALNMLSNALFPGNIRELENEIERAVTLADDNSQLTSELISLRFQKPPADESEDMDISGSLKQKVESLEIKLIKSALTESDGNILKAAEILQLSRAGLHKKLNRYHINPKDM